MNLEDLNIPRRIRPLRLPASETPHFVLEPTMECNIQCRSCYNRYRSLRKTLQEVRREIDLACEKRNLDTISILGGEPTLHPELPRIVSYIKSRGLYCQILTNGLRFVQPEGDRLLDMLIAAGLDRIVLHADVGQAHLREDLQGFCHGLFRKFEQRGLYFSLAVTLYRENLRSIPGIVREFADYRFFDGVLATLCREASEIIRGRPPAKDITLKAVFRSLLGQLGVQPTTYLPTSLNDGRISWLIYFYYYNIRTGAAFSLSSRLTSLFRRLYRFFFGRHMFGMTLRPHLLPFILFATGIAESVLAPTQFPVFLRLLRGAGSSRNIRFHYLVIQRGPEYNPEQNSLEICYHCPDATLRNGKLTPVCLADLISPYPGDSGADVPDRLVRAVYRHLEEI